MKSGEHPEESLLIKANGSDVFVSAVSVCHYEQQHTLKWRM